MPRRVSRRPRGRPPGLTPDVADKFVALLEEGNHLVDAADALAIPQSTLYDWLARGRDAAAAIRNHQRPDSPWAHRYADFSERVTAARGQAHINTVEVIGKVIRGGNLISEEETFTPDGGRSVKRVYSQPDGRLALEFLGRMSPDRWGRLGPARVEVTGADGGPVTVEQATPAAALAERLAALVAERDAERRELTDGGEDGVVDADVVG